MPSFRECIVKAAKAGIVNKQQEEELLKSFDDQLELFSKTLSELEATQAASNATYKILKRKVKQKAIENTIAAKKFTELKTELEKYLNSNGEVDVAQGYRALHGKAEGKRVLNNLEIRQKTVFGMLTKDLSDLMEAYAMPLIRRYKRASPRTIVEEMFAPSSTGNKGSEIIAKSVMEVFDKARVMLAKNGVLVKKNPNWKFPQSHNVRSIKKSKISNEEWVSFIKPLLDKSKMIDDKTGLTFDLVPEAEFDKALMASITNILSDGLGRGKKTGLKQFEESRFLVFKDADSFMSYNDRFGSDPIMMLYEQLDTLSRAIAETQIFGPKPNVVRNSLQSFVLDNAVKTRLDKRKKLAGVISRQNELDRSKTFIKKAQDEYDLFVGRGHLKSDAVTAKVFSDFRNILTGTLLGGSGITVLFGDLATTYANASMRGWSPWKAVVNSLSEQFTGRGARKDAAYLGLILDDLIQNNMAMGRFVDDVDSGGLAKVYASTLLRLGGISRFTQQARNAGGKFILSGSGLGKYIQYSLADLERLSKGKFNRFGKTITLLKQYGITEADWNIIRTSKTYKPKKGLFFIDPGQIANRTDIPEEQAISVATKLQDLVMTEQDHFVVVNSLKQQARTSKLERGTVGGELGLSFYMFKSFPINVILHNIQRAFTAPPGILNKTKYVATITTGMVLTAAATMLTYDLLSGRDPRKIYDKNFWMEAFFRSGALGPVGDALSGNPDARKLKEVSTGPVVSLFADTFGISIGAILDAINGKDVNYGGRISKFVRSWTPKPWYAKLVLQRYIFDQLDKQLNDNYYERLNRIESYNFKRGSDYWWRPGKLSPDRLPLQ